MLEELLSQPKPQNEGQTISVDTCEDEGVKPIESENAENNFSYRCPFTVYRNLRPICSLQVEMDLNPTPLTGAVDVDCSSKTEVLAANTVPVDVSLSCKTQFPSVSVLPRYSFSFIKYTLQRS